MLRIPSEKNQPVPAKDLPGVVLPFPVSGRRAKPAQFPPGAAATLPSVPAVGERPTMEAPRVAGWLRFAVIGSLLFHAIAFAAFQLRFADDLERASGAGAAASSEGTVTIPVELVVEATLPSAPSPADATDAEADQANPAQSTVETKDAAVEPELSKVAELMPELPEPAAVVLPEPKFEMPRPPQPTPVVLPSKDEAIKLALPEEEIAPPSPAEAAVAPHVPRPHEARETPREQAERAAPPPPQKSAPSRAASPSQAAGANRAGTAGAGGTSDAGGQAVISSYQAQVLAHLSRHRVYPPEARAQGVTGVARVTFSIGRNGQVLSASLAGSSGKAVLDQAAVAMVQRASPFPAIPAGISQSRLAFGAPIRFDLR